MDKEARAHIFISGIVQGVCFRSQAQETATALNLTGWVRNLYDGRVEIIAEGNDEKLQQLIRWCHKGPAGAVVEDIAVQTEKSTGEFSKFEINYSW